MAIPSLAAMAALTLLQNPHMQPEDVSVDYTPYAAPARAIQRWWRRRGVLNRAATTINKLIRAFGVRCFISRNQHFLTSNLLVNRVGAFLMYGFQPGFMDSLWAGVRDRLISPRDMRSGRRYLAQRRALARVSYWITNTRYHSTNLETLDGILDGGL